MHRHIAEDLVDLSPMAVDKALVLAAFPIGLGEYIAFGNDHNDMQLFQNARFAGPAAVVGTAAGTLSSCCPDGCGLSSARLCFTPADSSLGSPRAAVSARSRSSCAGSIPGGGKRSLNIGSSGTCLSTRNGSTSHTMRMVSRTYGERW
ncbi:hypothetical protein GCM10010435_23100 [Winogradskya consettensis]|uniref:Uncharacterized protein n=1 Tax=Winogradskya consettensis TaxID=113560 RepID=A0A919SPU0_9ACTN|nr:hypothetical protein Aco04nite_44810 [Actinoplanes consettensis]